jgi:hypothetical protein
MRFASLALLALLLGCASPSRAPKPSPYHYGAVTDARRADKQPLLHGR